MQKTGQTELLTGWVKVAYWNLGVLGEYLLLSQSKMQKTGQTEISIWFKLGKWKLGVRYAIETGQKKIAILGYLFA